MKSYTLWLVLSAATIAAGMIVPYVILAGGTTSSVFVFWCAFALVVIALIVAGTSGWSDPE